MNYSSFGVDICRADRFVNWLKNQPSTDKRVISGIGGFASLYQINFPQMQEPCLASSTDGVGTKIKLALQYNSLKNLGQDLVGMCVNDLICVGATPLFFLDYYACGKLEEKKAQAFIEGIYKACSQVPCSLIGGETAEMPDLYQNSDFDCAGFSIGIVDRKDILKPSLVQKTDKLIGIPSSGFHSNGYSLLRKIFEPDMKQWTEKLLRPTELYPKIFNQVLKGKVHALAHITGGGIDNILRVVPKGTVIELQTWDIPSEFLEAQKRARLNLKELLTTLNCGIGLVAFVSETSFEDIIKKLKTFGIQPISLGEVMDIDSQQKSVWKLNQIESRGSF